MAKVKIPQMKLKIMSVEEVDGSEKEPHFKKPMYKINGGDYWASSVATDNQDKEKFSLVVGRTYDVGVTVDNWIWPLKKK